MAQTQSALLPAKGDILLRQAGGGGQTLQQLGGAGVIVCTTGKLGLMVKRKRLNVVNRTVQTGGRNTKGRYDGGRTRDGAAAQARQDQGIRTQQADRQKKPETDLHEAPFFREAHKRERYLLDRPGQAHAVPNRP